MWWVRWSTSPNNGPGDTAHTRTKGLEAQGGGPSHDSNVKVNLQAVLNLKGYIYIYIYRGHLQVKLKYKYKYKYEKLLLLARS